jgi:hypothetical protein
VNLDENKMTKLFDKDRLEAWYDGSAISIIAIGSHGDPLDLAKDEVKAFIVKLQSLVDQASKS